MSHRSVQTIVFETTVQGLLDENAGLRKDRGFLAILLVGAGISNVIALLAAFNII
jgi:hypothetical protein